MAPESFRLDTVAANLIERLEGARRTWAGQPEEAGKGFRRIAEEVVDAVVREQDELMGDARYGLVLRREVLETLLPRYQRLAIDQTALEELGYRSWRRGDPVARVVGTSLAFLGALAMERVIHHPISLVFFVFALGVPFIPELRAWYHRRMYERMLQEVVDDMSRIQDNLDSLPQHEAELDHASGLDEAEASGTGDASGARKGEARHGAAQEQTKQKSKEHA